MNDPTYTTQIAPGGHWSLRLRQGTYLRLTDLCGNGNVGMLFYNPENMLERYNAPDTLKCQHTFKLTQGHCLYSDMGRIFASIIDDNVGWHETVCGNIHAAEVTERWGARNYQDDRNAWHQNGYDAFLTELAKYGLGAADIASNLNWFSRVSSDSAGNISRHHDNSPAGGQVTLRFEIDTLVILHNCPHPLDFSTDYPQRPIRVDIGAAQPVTDDDFCMNFRPENQRGFANNKLYLLGR